MSLKGTEKDGDIKADSERNILRIREGRERGTQTKKCRETDLQSVRQADREREKDRDCQRWKHKNRET